MGKERKMKNWIVGSWDKSGFHDRGQFSVAPSFPPLQLRLGSTIARATLALGKQVFQTFPLSRKFAPRSNKCFSGALFFRVHVGNDQERKRGKTPGCNEEALFSSLHLPYYYLWVVRTGKTCGEKYGIPASRRFRTIFFPLRPMNSK